MILTQYKEYEDYLGFAVAGNFANHLGEAGEADEFAVIKTEKKDAPKGIFPFYIKKDDSFLSTYPISHDVIKVYDKEDQNLQVEAEVALICDFVYENGKMIDIIPKKFSAFNDCSIRVNDGKKLSTKKNWGAQTKGLSYDFIDINSFEKEDSILNKYHIASFVRREGILHEYGVTCPVSSYSYFYKQLKDWMIEKFNTQEDCGPLEEIQPFLKNANNAKGMIIAAGATAYTEFGKHNFLKRGDEIFVYVYDAHIHSYQDIIDDISGVGVYLGQCSKLYQIVE